MIGLILYGNNFMLGKKLACSLWSVSMLALCLIKAGSFISVSRLLVFLYQVADLNKWVRGLLYASLCVFELNVSLWRKVFNLLLLKLQYFSPLSYYRPGQQWRNWQWLQSGRTMAWEYLATFTLTEMVTSFSPIWGSICTFERVDIFHSPLNPSTSEPLT